MRFDVGLLISFTLKRLTSQNAWLGDGLFLQLLPLQSRMRSFYDILEIAERATLAEIRSAYLRLAREYHPDRIPEHLTKLRADAEEKFKEIQEAWTVLGEPERRRLYDVRLRDRQRAASAEPVVRNRAGTARWRTWNAALYRKDVLIYAGLIILMTSVLAGIGGLLVSHEAAVLPPSRTDDGENIGGGVILRMREYNTLPRHVRTWSTSGGNGLDIQLLSAKLQANQLELVFRVRAGEHSDLLLYEPPGSTLRKRTALRKQMMVDHNLEELYIQDNKGAKFYSTTGLVGRQQTDFNLYNFTRRINFRPHEAVVLSAKFPPISDSAAPITFVSPRLADWQPEWRWPAIILK